MPLVLAGVAVAAVAAVAVPLVTMRLAAPHATGRQVQVAGLTITAIASDAVAPRMTRDQAVASVNAFVPGHPVLLPHGGPAVAGLDVQSALFVPHVEDVVGPCVHYFLREPMNVWVVSVQAPAQAGWGGVRGAFLVDDGTGNVSGGDLLITPARLGAPAC